MGQQQTKHYNLPLGKDYINSYCRGHQLKKDSEIFNSINLENLVPDYPSISDVFNYKLNGVGYSFKTKPPVVINPLNKLINTTILPKDVEWSSKCYLVNEKIIKMLVSQGNILIAGIIMDNDFLFEVLKVTNDTTLSDIILITGYNEESFIIKTKWTLETIEISWDYLGYIQEIWNIYLESPEEKYLNNLLE